MIHKKGGRIRTYTLTMPHRLQPISLGRVGVRKGRNEFMPQRSLWKSIFLARNKARVLFGQAIDSITEPNKIIPLVLSIHLSRHNILSTYDGDHICWHVMFGHRIESL